MGRRPSPAGPPCAVRPGSLAARRRFPSELATQLAFTQLTSLGKLHRANLTGRTSPGEPHRVNLTG